MRLILVAFLFVCSSCSIYNYNVLQSNIKGTERDPFSYEDDSIRLRYAYSYGMGRLSIFNKSKQPLYIDWTRSSIIFNGESRRYVEISDLSDMSFIPPNSGMNEIPFGLPVIEPPIMFGNAPKEHSHYTEQSSPLNFRSYLVMSPTEDFYETIMMDHRFWIAEVWQSNEKLPIKKRPDVIAYSTLTEGGHAATVLVGTAAAIGVIAFCVTHPTPEEP